LRAVEQGLPLVRAANNGLSGIVDPYGRIIDALALNAVGVVDATLPAKVQLPLSEDIIPLQFWIVICMVLIAMLAYFLRHRTRVG
jgi:apolipoprotein N-acyltransferase